jgi:hypothetical protein
MFQYAILLLICLGVAGCALWTGSVGWAGMSRTVRRADEPFWFWVCIGVPLAFAAYLIFALLKTMTATPA